MKVHDNSPGTNANLAQQPLLEFGPKPQDVHDYIDLLSIIEAGGSCGFDPRVNAELTSVQIDGGSIGSFVNPDIATNGIDAKTRMKLGQQLYIAGALGLFVGDTIISERSHTARASVSLPVASLLPPRPTRDSLSGYIGQDGSAYSRVRGDAIYAAHFVAANADHFRQPNAFEKLFGRVVSQAEQGHLDVLDKAGDVRGSMSLVRQVAYILGYNTDMFKQVQGGHCVAQVNGIRKGFDAPNTHFKIHGKPRQ